MPLSPLKIPCGLTWDGTRFSTLRTTTWIRCACVRTCVDFTVVTNISEERFTFIVRVDLTMAARGYKALCARRQKSQFMVTLGTCSCCRVTFTARHVCKQDCKWGRPGRGTQTVRRRRRRPTLLSHCRSVLRCTRKCKEEEEDQTLSSYREVKVVMKQKYLAREGAVNRQFWRKATDNV
jgi:hypothetical protein